jgi:hypothetical protein
MRLDQTLASVVALLSLPAAPASAERPLVELLRHAGEYVVGYEHAFKLVVAEEAYVQRLRVTASGPVHEMRRLGSDVVFVQVPGAALPFWLLRDVYDVDGRPVRDREARLERVLLGGGGEGLSRARAIADEGARFNLGRSRRNVNVPTMVLAFLHPSVQPRFSFERKGAGTIEGRPFVEIEFRELGAPTVVRGPDARPDVFSSGRVWLENGEAGTVGRTELVLEQSGEGVRTRVVLTTEYRPYPSLALWVPVEMRDRLQSELAGSRGRSGPVEFVEGLAAYTGFRQAGVSTREQLQETRPQAP